MPINTCRKLSIFLLAHIFLLITLYKSSIRTPPFLGVFGNLRTLVSWYKNYFILYELLQILGYVLTAMSELTVAQQIPPLHKQWQKHEFENYCMLLWC